jgi:hypothetical protein
MRTSLLRFTGVRHPGDPSSRTLEARLCRFQKVDQTIGLMGHPAKHHSLTKQVNDLITSNIFNQHTTPKSSLDAKNSSSIQSDVRIWGNSNLGSTGLVDSVVRQYSAGADNTKSTSDRKSDYHFIRGNKMPPLSAKAVNYLFRNRPCNPMRGTVIGYLYDRSVQTDSFY